MKNIVIPEDFPITYLSPGPVPDEEKEITARPICSCRYIVFYRDKYGYEYMGTGYRAGCLSPGTT